MPAGYITLGQISLSLLEVACNRCDRRGRLNIDRLMAEHGEQPPVPELRQVIAADCPRRIQERFPIRAGCISPGWPDSWSIRSLAAARRSMLSRAKGSSRRSPRMPDRRRGLVARALERRAAGHGLTLEAGD
jgi:hypothetical protein